MGASNEPRRVHFHAPDDLVARLDSIAEVRDTDRTHLLVEAIREYIQETVDDDAFQARVTSKYYDEQIAYGTVKRLLGATAARRLRILKDSLETDPHELEISPSILLSRNPDGQWTARNLDVGVSAQGVSRDEALSSLDDVVEAVSGEGGQEPTDDDLRELGLDPAENVSADDLPDILDQ